MLLFVPDLRQGLLIDANLVITAIIFIIVVVPKATLVIAAL